MSSFFTNKLDKKKQFDAILKHDQVIFEEPQDWQTKSIGASPLMVVFPVVGEQLKGTYQTELSALAYRPIPNEKDIAAAFVQLTTLVVRPFIVDWFNSNLTLCPEFSTQKAIDNLAVEIEIQRLLKKSAFRLPHRRFYPESLLSSKPFMQNNFSKRRFVS